MSFGLSIRLLQPAFPGCPSDRLSISSLTVARQRGIYTRFLLIAAMRLPEPQIDKDRRTDEGQNLFPDFMDVNVKMNRCQIRQDATRPTPGH